MGNESSSLSTLELLRTVAAVEAALSREPAQRSVQLQHAWDPKDCSDNMTVLQDGLVVKRQSQAGRTDAVRGREGYGDGIHVWEIHWPKAQRGSHAVVGVASYQCPLTCKGNTSLIGSNDESIGWDISRKVLLFNGVELRKFPEGVPSNYVIPEVIIMTLNMGEGTLYFKAENRDFGRAVSGLRAIGKLLYPAVSVVFGGAEISIKYLGGSETVSGRGISMGAPLAFHDICGKMAKLEDNNCTASRIKPLEEYHGAVVLTSRPLKEGELFGVRLENNVGKWTGSLDFGVTTNSPMELTFPDTMTDYKQGHTWMYSGSNIMYNGNTIQNMSADLHSLPTGGTVSVVKTSGGELEFLVDGTTVGKINLRLYAEKALYGVVDVYGKCSKVTLLGDQPLASQQTFEGNVDNVDSQTIMSDVEKTVNMLKEKDPSKIRLVHQTVTANLDRLYWRLSGRKYRQVIGDQLTDLGLPANALGYLKFLQRCGLDKDAVRDCYLTILSVIWNYSDNSVKFSTALGTEGLLDFLMERLNELAGSRIRNEVTRNLVSHYFGVLHNCAKAADNRPLYHKQGFVKMAASFLQYDLPTTLAMNILMAMSYVYQPPGEVKLLESPEEVIKQGVTMMRKAAQQEGNHYYDGWHADELVMGLAQLSANENNRNMMIQQDIVGALVELIRRGNDNEQECALNALWSLTTLESRAHILKNPDVKGLLESVKGCRVEAVSQAAKRTFTKLFPDPTNRALPANKNCPYFKHCKTFMESIDLDTTFIESKEDVCYCVDCHCARGDKSTYPRGQPPKEYSLPVGWSRFGIKPPPRAFAKDVEAFKKWHRAFHGTKKDAVKNILNVGDLLMPGDSSLGGYKMKPRPGHFTDDRKPEGFNIKQVFVSPSVRYAGHDAYATPYNFTGSDGKTYKARVALQVLIEPDSYKVGPQTIGATNRIDPNFENEELEWMTGSRGCCIIYGLLVKMDA